MLPAATSGHKRPAVRRRTRASRRQQPSTAIATPRSCSIRNGVAVYGARSASHHHESRCVRIPEDDVPGLVRGQAGRRGVAQTASPPSRNSSTPRRATLSGESGTACGEPSGNARRGQVEPAESDPEADERHVLHGRVGTADQQGSDERDRVDQRREGWLVVGQVGRERGEDHQGRHDDEHRAGDDQGPRGEPHERDRKEEHHAVVRQDHLDVGGR